MHGIVLPVELKGLVDRGAVDRRLHMPHDPEAILEADDCALIQTEQVAGLKTEVAASQVAVEAVRELKVRSVPRKSKRCRQSDDTKIRLGQLQRTLIVGRGGG